MWKNICIKVLERWQHFIIYWWIRMQLIQYRTQHADCDASLPMSHCRLNERKFFILQNIENKRCKIVANLLFRFLFRNKLMTLVIWEPSTCSGGRLKTEAVGFLRVNTASLPASLELDRDYLFDFILLAWSLLSVRPLPALATGRHTSMAHEAGGRSERFVL